MNQIYIPNENAPTLTSQHGDMIYRLTHLILFLHLFMLITLNHYYRQTCNRRESLTQFEWVSNNIYLFTFSYSHRITTEIFFPLLHYFIDDCGSVSGNKGKLCEDHSVCLCSISFSITFFLVVYWFIKRYWRYAWHFTVGYRTIWLYHPYMCVRVFDEALEWKMKINLIYA